MRAYWKGYLKLALVSCPIGLHPASSTAERIAFRQINKVTGNRLRQQLIDEETREPVGPEHKGRGYEVAKGQYILMDDEQLEAIEIESTHVIEIDIFVPRSQIDQRYLDTPYYIAPNAPAAGAAPGRQSHGGAAPKRRGGHATGDAASKHSRSAKEGMRRVRSWAACRIPLREVTAAMISGSCKRMCAIAHMRLQLP